MTVGFSVDQDSQQEERAKLQETAGKLKQEIEEKERSQQELGQTILSKEEELARAKESVMIFVFFVVFCPF